jgi:fumarate reductase flavoprotein subunit
MTTKVLDCDLVVLGAGGSGLVAAVKAYDLTGKKVIILEKAKKPGGATYFAGGLASVKDSKWQKDAGYQVSEPQDITGQFFDWFVSKGGVERFYRVAKPEENKQRSIYTLARTEKYKDLPDPSIGPGRGGTFIVDKMVECCQEQGIQILYETPARKFITDAKGKVTGVLAVAKDGQLLVNCKACVIASGGFGRDFEKLKKYWPEAYNNKELFILCPPGMTGDGIKMAEEIGAHIDQKKWSMSQAGGFFADGPIHHPYSWAVQSLMSNQMFVYINLDGKRWSRSEGSLGDQPGGVVYSVADNDIIETSGSQLGSGGGMGGMMGSTDSDPNSNEAKAIKKWREDLEYEAAIDDEGASGNHVKKANTLVELALKMKIDPAVFVETIKEYNKLIETGKSQGFDGQGGMRGQSLKPIKTPPFYAIYGHRFSQCTKGLHGIAVNSKLEVVNSNGEAMHGLYAAGDACTIYGGLIIDGPSARRTDSTGAASEASGGAPAGGGPGGSSGGAPSGMGSPGPGAASRVNILSTEPSPCGGSSGAIISGYYAALGVAEYLKNN